MPALPAQRRAAKAWRAAVPGLTAILATLALSACASANRIVADTGEPANYREAHPIVLTHGSRSIDIFLAGGVGQIGARQTADIRAFAAEYRRSGEGPLLIGLPTTDPQARRALEGIRTALAEAGVRTTRSGSYRPADPEAIAPVKLAFTMLKAEVDSRCGQWPTDIGGGGGNLESWQNKGQPWENFGCSYQNMLAQQVADPLDLVRGRPEGPSSGARRTTVLNKYSKGESTVTIYPDQGREKIFSGVGQ